MGTSLAIPYFVLFIALMNLYLGYVVAVYLGFGPKPARRTANAKALMHDPAAALPRLLMATNDSAAHAAATHDSEASGDSSSASSATSPTHGSDEAKALPPSLPVFDKPDELPPDDPEITKLFAEVQATAPPASPEVEPQDNLTTKTSAPEAASADEVSAPESSSPADSSEHVAASLPDESSATSSTESSNEMDAVMAALAAADADDAASGSAPIVQVSGEPLVASDESADQLAPHELDAVLAALAAEPQVDDANPASASQAISLSSNAEPRCEIEDAVLAAMREVKDEAGAATSSNAFVSISGPVNETTKSQSPLVAGTPVPALENDALDAVMSALKAEPMRPLDTQAAAMSVISESPESAAEISTGDIDAAVTAALLEPTPETAAFPLSPLVQ